MNTQDATPNKKVDLFSHNEELKGSGLTESTWVSAGVYTETDQSKINALLNRKRSSHNFGASLIYPYFSLNGKPTGYAVIKPRWPRYDRNNKPIKYDAPLSTPAQAYFPLFAREGILQSERLLITEGVKKTLCACQHGFPTIGLGGVWGWKVKNGGLLPELEAFSWQGKRVVIVFDSDRVGNPSIQAAEKQLSKILSKRGAVVTVATLPPGADLAKSGIDDYFVNGGTRENFTAIMDRASPGATCVSSFDDDLPELLVDFDEQRVNNEAVAHLAKDPETYCRGGMLCRVIYDPSQSTLDNIVGRMEPRIEKMTAPILSERLSTVARWMENTANPDQRARGEDRIRQIHPPKKVIEAILDKRIWPEINSLTSLAMFPVILRDGTMLTKPGYHAESGLYFAPHNPTEVTVKESPTREDARRAVGELSEVIVDFPFAEECHRSAWFAALLTPLARFAISGATPLFLIEANTAGSGKGLLADCISLIVQGAAMPVAILPREDGELRKKITSILLAGKSFSLIDNIQDRIGSSELDGMITSTMWSDRELGYSRNVELPNLTTWLATGNNLEVIGDTMRRICPIRLLTDEERPEDRTSFKHKNLREWILSHRNRLLSAALTILKSYFAASCPDMGLPNWGSFESWSDIVRGAVVWAGLPDPSEGRESLRELATDDVKNAMLSLMASWDGIDPSGKGLTVGQIVSEINGLHCDDELKENLQMITGGCRAEDISSQLGRQFRRHANNWIGGYRIVKKRKLKGINRWGVEKATSAVIVPSSSIIANSPASTEEDEADWPTDDNDGGSIYFGIDGIDALRG